MIDALEAVLVLCREDAGVAAQVGMRVASKQQFGTSTTRGAWTTPAKALVITYDQGGTPDLDCPIQQVRLMVRCYGADEVAASQVYGALVELVRAAERRVVTTSRGDGLIYWVRLDGTPQFLYDFDLSMDFLQCFFEARVAETPVP